MAFVVKTSLSLLLSRMTEFSPVRTTRFASTVLTADVSKLFLMSYDTRMPRAHNFSGVVLASESRRPIFEREGLWRLCFPLGPGFWALLQRTERRLAKCELLPLAWRWT